MGDPVALGEPVADDDRPADDDEGLLALEDGLSPDGLEDELVPRAADDGDDHLANHVAAQDQNLSFIELSGIDEFLEHDG